MLRSQWIMVENTKNNGSELSKGLRFESVSICAVVFWLLIRKVEQTKLGRGQIERQTTIMTDSASMNGRGVTWRAIKARHPHGNVCFVLLFVLFQCGLGLYPSTARLRVAFGIVTVIPSRASVSRTWHPNRDVSVRPKARSSMSSSSTTGSGSFS